MRTIVQSMVLCALLLCDGATSASSCSKTDWVNHPILCRLLERVEENMEEVAAEITHWARSVGLLIEYPLPGMTPLEENEAQVRQLSTEDDSLPVVLAHGMGDSCFNKGMQDLTKHTGDLLGGVYSVCIPTGKNQAQDTLHGYFMSMDDNVHVFADKVRKDSNLANGFYAVGLSQGNNVIRGYIAMYNDPPVKAFISINGVNAGVGAVPHCIPKDQKVEKEDDSLTNNMCDLLMEQASKRAYNSFAQKHSFQANYWRDPRPVESDAYKKFSQLARWNNEGYEVNMTLNENWAKTDKFVWVEALQDTMVWPKEGEQWGAPDPSDPFLKILPMNETEWYKEDLFGLRTAQEAGKNAFESFEGDHLSFTADEYKRWITTYLTV